jgi:hypothetical protein
MTQADRELQQMFFMCDSSNHGRMAHDEHFEDVFGSRYGNSRDRQIDAKHQVNKIKGGTRSGR